jgi:phage terminase small subunit
MEAEASVWHHTIENQAPGVFRPIDSAALRQYCWFLSQLLLAQAELRQWSESKKKPGETRFLRRARNGALVVHNLFGLVKDLRIQVANLECLLGLNPVSRERIHAGVQTELFSDKDNARDPWATFEVPGSTAGERDEKLN